MQDFAKWGKYYRDSFGWSCIPVDLLRKRPYVRVIEYEQVRPPTDEELDTWEKQFPDAALALCTGKVSKVLVLDVDLKLVDSQGKARKAIHPPADQYPIPLTVQAKTQSGGVHHYFRYKESDVFTIGTNLFSDRDDIWCDWRGTGGYVLLPPSKNYTWTNDPLNTEIADAPQWFTNMLTIRKKEKFNIHDVFGAKTKISERNTTAARFIGHLIWDKPNDLFPHYWAFIQWWNENYLEEPLPYQELWMTFQSIVSKEMTRRTVINKV